MSHLIWISILRVVVLCGEKKMQHMSHVVPAVPNLFERECNTQVSTEVHEIWISVTSKKVSYHNGQFWIILSIQTRNKASFAHLGF